MHWLKKGAGFSKTQHISALSNQASKKNMVDK